MSYKFEDKKLVEAIDRFAKSNAADELQIGQAMLERYCNALHGDDEIVAGAETAMAFLVKIAGLRERFQKSLIDNKIYLHRDTLPGAIGIVADAVHQVIKPLDPCGLLMDQIVVHIQKGFDDACETLES